MNQGMFVCLVRVRLFMGAVHSLKEKRSIVKSLMEKTRHKFPLSIAEVGDHDLWQSCLVGFALVGNNQGLLEREMEKVLDYMEQTGEAEVVEFNHEIVSY